MSGLLRLVVSYIHNGINVSLAIVHEMGGMTRQAFLNASQKVADTGKIKEFNQAEAVHTAMQFIGQRAEIGRTLSFSNQIRWNHDESM